MGTLDFDRIVSDELLDAVRPGGPLDLLVTRAAAHRGKADVQLRREPDGSISAATLYIGLTAALRIDERSGSFRLWAHPTHKVSGQFDPRWSAWQWLDALVEEIANINAYLDRLLTDDGIHARWYAREGVVQAALTNYASATVGVIQREASVWSTPGSDAVAAASVSADRIWQAVTSTGRSDRWWPGIRDRGKRPGMGRSVDLLGIDTQGRLAVIEVKPAGEIGKIPWAIAQVAVYAELFAEWLHHNPAAPETLAKMAHQRHVLGLLDAKWSTPLTPTARVAPVLAIGHGKSSKHARPRIAQIAEALEACPPTAPWATRLDPAEVWFSGPQGQITEVWRPGQEARPE